jgi:hypothetical protein
MTVAVDMTVAISIFLKRDLKLAAIGQFHALAQAAFAAKTIQHARNPAGILAEFAGLALKTVNFLDDLDRNYHMIVREVKQGVGVVQQNVGVENVIFHFLIL